jgi:uncharacterized protein YndB with AHSA1/START domain
MSSMKIAAIVAGVLVAFVLIVAIIGWLQPVAHKAERERAFAVPPDSLYSLIADVEKAPTWRKKVKSVEIVADSSGKRSFREVSSDGTILYVVEEAVPGKRFVTRIADKSLPFGGKWTFELTPSGANTTLRITEDGEVYNPIFRFVSRFVMGHHATIDAYLGDLAARVPPG